MMLYHVIDNISIGVVEAVANRFHLFPVYHLTCKLMHYPDDGEEGGMCFSGR